MRTTKSEYFEKLKSPKWQKKRLEVLEAAGWRCESCDEEDKTLHVHHKVYHRGHEPWEYELNELQCLCECCHGCVTRNLASFKDAVSSLQSISDGFADVERCTGYIRATIGISELTDITVETYEEAMGVANAIGQGCTTEEVLMALDGNKLSVDRFPVCRPKQEK